MEVQFDRQILNRALDYTLDVVDKRSAMPVLSHCLIETDDLGVVISATDLETSFRGVFPAVVEKPGALVVPARVLHSLSRSLPVERLELAAQGQQAVLQADGCRYKLNLLPTDQFPPLAVPDSDDLPEIEAEMLLDLIAKTEFSVGERYNYQLAGLFWEKIAAEEGLFLRLVATDGHRLSLAERPFPEVEKLGLGDGILVPASALRAIRKFVADAELDGKVALGVRGKTLGFKADHKELTVRLLDGKFPDYRRLLAAPDDLRFSFNRQELEEALRRLTRLTTDKFVAVTFAFSGAEAAELSHENPEVGGGQERVIILDRRGAATDSVSMRFNAKYILEPLRVMRGETVTLAVNGPNRPSRLMDPDDPGSVFLVMPMSL